MRSKVLVFLVALLLIASFSAVWAEGTPESEAGDEKPFIGFITNGPYEFWTYSAAAIEVLEEDLNIDVEFLLPPNGLPEEQRRFIESLVARDVDGIGISVTDPDNSTPFLNSIIDRGVPMVMFDSDAPNSERLAYVGMSNYAAGRMAGETVKEVLPDGGEFVIIVGRLDAQNAIERRQGIIDELNGEPYQAQYPGQMTPNRANIELDGGKWTLLETATDGGDQSRAKSNAEDAILRYEDMDLMVGMWSYSTPAIISAVRDANLLGEMNIIAFDQETEVLQGIEDGYVFATMGQDPFTYGVRTIEILNEVIRGLDPEIPADGLVDVPAVKITGDNIEEVWAKYRQQLNSGREYLEGVNATEVE